MRKNRISFLFTILSIFTMLPAQGQDAEENKVNKKWMFGLSFSPDYCYRSLQAEASSEIVLQSRNKTEIPKFGYTAGAHIIWRMHKKIDLESGIRYADKGYKTNNSTLAWTSNDVSLPTKYRIVYRYQYFEVPLKLNYYILNTKLRLFLTTGISVNLFNRQQTKLILEESDGSSNSALSENDLGFSTLNFSIFVGGGILYPVTKSWSVRMQPLYRMSLSPLRPSMDLKERLFSTGMEVGIYYTLKK